MSLSKKTNKKEKEYDVDISIKLLEESDEKDGYETSYVKLNFVGKTINTVIMNTLRRVILSLIPTYAFNSDNIIISNNTSIFNNDYMRLRLSNLPIYLTKDLNNKYRKKKNIENLNVINGINTLDDSKDLEYRANLGSAEVDLTADSYKTQDITNNLTISVNVKNTSDNDVMNVMSNTLGVKYYYGKEQISHIYTNPLLIIQLKPQQEFTCTMTSNLNIAMYHATYSPCSMCYYDERDEEGNNIDFSVLSRRQISEKDIILRACSIIERKVRNTGDMFINSIEKYNADSYKANKMNEEDISTSHLRAGTIVIPGEQHTIGNLISRYLQEHNDISFAGYKVGHPNVRQVEIKYICQTNILSVIDDITERILKIFGTIKEQIEKMPDFGYKYI